eukprot:g33191.t1
MRCLQSALKELLQPDAECIGAAIGASIEAWQSAMLLMKDATQRSLQLEVGAVVAYASALRQGGCFQKLRRLLGEAYRATVAMPMPRISEDEGAEREEVLEVELDEEEDATSDSAAPQIPEVLEPIDVVLSMKMEFETLVDNVHGKIAELQKVIQAGPIAPEIRRTRGLKSMGSKEALDLAKEPEVLVKRRQVKAKKGDEKKDWEHFQEKMRLMSRRYGASVGGRDGSNDIRLHGRWMELSTQFAAQGNLEARPARAAVRAHRNSTLELLEEAGAGIPLWHPSGYFRLMWDGFSVLITLLDAFTMPVSLAWEADDSGADTLYAIFWTTFFFWSIDIPITCNTAVYINGEIKKNRCMVLWTYLRTWFLFDASLVTLDILTLVALSPDSEMRFLRQFRILRALRLLRLLKMSKFNILLQELGRSCSINRAAVADFSHGHCQYLRADSSSASPPHLWLVFPGPHAGGGWPHQLGHNV